MKERKKWNALKQCKNKLIFFIFLLGSYIVGWMVFLNLFTNKMSILKPSLWNLGFKYQLLLPLENIQPFWLLSSLIFLTRINREKESLKQKFEERKDSDQIILSKFVKTYSILFGHYLPNKVIWEKKGDNFIILMKFGQFLFFFFCLSDFLCSFFFFLSENW